MEDALYTRRLKHIANQCMFRQIFFAQRSSYFYKQLSGKDDFILVPAGK